MGNGRVDAGVLEEIPSLLPVFLQDDSTVVGVAQSEFDHSVLVGKAGGGGALSQEQSGCAVQSHRVAHEENRGVGIALVQDVADRSDDSCVDLLHEFWSLCLDLLSQLPEWNHGFVDCVHRKSRCFQFLVCHELRQLVVPKRKRSDEKFERDSGSPFCPLEESGFNANLHDTVSDDALDVGGRLNASEGRRCEDEVGQMVFLHFHGSAHQLTLQLPHLCQRGVQFEVQVAPSVWESDREIDVEGEVVAAPAGETGLKPCGEESVHPFARSSDDHCALSVSLQGSGDSEFL